MNNLIINPQFIGSQQTHRKKKITLNRSPRMSVFWERGYPDLPACSPRRGSVNGLVRPSFSINNSRPSRGAKPREVDNTKTYRMSSLPR